MLNFITLSHVRRPRYRVHKGVSRSAGRPRRPRRLPPARGPPGQEGELSGIAAAAGSGSGSPGTASAPPRRALAPGRHQHEGQRGEVVPERWVRRSALARQLLSTGKKKKNNKPSQQRVPAQRCSGGYRRVRTGESRGSAWHDQRPGDLARAAEPVQTGGHRAGRGRCCGPLERGRLRAAVSASAQLRVGFAVHCPGLGTAYSCAQRAGTCRGTASLAWGCQRFC